MHSLLAAFTLRWEKKLNKKIFLDSFTCDSHGLVQAKYLFIQTNMYFGKLACV